MKLTRFSLVFLLTILITRIFVYIVPRTSSIYSDKFHHIYIGIGLLVVYLFIKHHEYANYLLALILGLIVDQLTAAPFYLAVVLNNPIANHTFWHYWSPYSLISTLIVVIISIILIEKYGNK
tara:strand:- start:379 stop:744 length:366 start_codon:yes stop_codon:yes gene_type:complete